MDGLRIPSRPNRDRGAPGPGLGVTVTAAAPDAASCSRTEALLRDDTATYIMVKRQKTRLGCKGCKIYALDLLLVLRNLNAV